MAHSHSSRSAVADPATGTGNGGSAQTSNPGQDPGIRWANSGARLFIRFYKVGISPILPGRCRFYPSCSQYSMECFEKLPFWRALGKSLWRIARCNPLSKGYFDPVFPEDHPEYQEQRKHS
ncbi:MAG: membrane protein insertion efficiency factor YidD [Leptospiraceae bacterium]|nr:membrane protein insertion efficiency factor YidD [Leptospiraceae bacterium]